MRITRNSLYPELRKHYRSLQLAAYKQDSALGSRFSHLYVAHAAAPIAPRL
jgi:hypothetical protein